MFFEADLKDKHYKIDITENRHSWNVSMQQDGGDWKRFEISKKDFRLVENVISFIHEGRSYVLDAFGSGTEWDVYTRGAYQKIRIYNDEAILHESLKKGGLLGAAEQLSSGMPGKIVKIMVQPGQELKANQPILIMEAMKMENEMRASHDCKVKDVLIKAGDSVESGATLVTFETK